MIIGKYLGFGWISHVLFMGDKQYKISQVFFESKCDVLYIKMVFCVMLENINKFLNKQVT